MDFLANGSVFPKWQVQVTPCGLCGRQQRLSCNKGGVRCAVGPLGLVSASSSQGGGALNAAGPLSLATAPSPQGGGVNGVSGPSQLAREGEECVVPRILQA